jgi:ATP phosphoribosyltransferase regulatory subunit
MGIFQGLVGGAGLDAEQAATLFEALQRKARPEIDAHLVDFEVAPIVAEPIAVLSDLNGDPSVLDIASVKLANCPGPVLQALEDLREIGRLIAARTPDVELHIDLAELRGYHYHTGVMFAAYTPGQGQALAKGGRYDGVARVFGRARAATGFSTDLKLLSAFCPEDVAPAAGIYAPWSEDPRLHEMIAGLRRAGRQVIQGLPRQEGGARQMGCDKMLICMDDRWSVTDLDPIDGRH